MKNYATKMASILLQTFLGPDEDIFHNLGQCRHINAGNCFADDVFYCFKVAWFICKHLIFQITPKEKSGTGKLSDLAGQLMSPNRSILCYTWNIDMELAGQLLDKALEIRAVPQNAEGLVTLA